MRSKYSIYASILVLVIGLLSVGCGGGGGGGGGAIIIPTTTSTTTTSVSGTTGSATSTTSSSATASAGSFGMQPKVAAVVPTSDTVATLIVDSDGDSKFTSADMKYATPVLSDGSFSFDEVSISDTASSTMAQLTVQKDGFAPVVKMLHLSKDTPVSVLAQVGEIPVLTVVNKLPDVDSRMNTYLKFGINKTESGVKAYSRFVSLSELQAEADLDLNDSTVSESTIPLSAFADNVTSVTAKLQSFDSTNEKDIAAFPGAFSGHGKPSVSGSATTSDVENPLESAAFDMIKLTDQNGKDIVLNVSSASSKLLAPTATTCGGMFWRRHVTSAQDAIIMGWGDDDNDSSNGYQVPIWSNDNSTNSWEYVGLATYDHDTYTFEMCVDTKWQGYLNCDSEISIGVAPKQLCVHASDQFGDGIGGFELISKNGNSYSTAFVNQSGEAKLSLGADSDSADEVNNNWEFYYIGSITSWTRMRITQNATDSTSSDCDYDLNISISNPYSVTVKVKAYAQDDNATALKDVRVGVTNRNYIDSYSNFMSTGSDGESAVFKVKPNVTYVAVYKAGSANVRVNSIVVAPEVSDTGRSVTVNVQDVNKAPVCSIYVDRDKIKTTDSTLGFRIMGRDSNGDAVVLKSLKLNGTELAENVDYIPTVKSSHNGSFYMEGILELNSSTIGSITPLISEGSFTIEAVLDDGKLSSASTDTFAVVQNSAPEISTIYFVDANSTKRYYQRSAIPVGEYYVYAIAYDNDGDSISVDVKVDGNDAYRVAVALGLGEHNISVRATEDSTPELLSTTRDFSIYIGNHAPILGSVVAMPQRVDIKKNETFTIRAIATDIDGDVLTLKATDENGTEYSFTKSPYNDEYTSEEITIATAKKDNQFKVVASDGDKNSTVISVSVESYESNLPPVFTKELSDKSVEVNTQQTFECEATDPEGTPVTYSWSIDGVSQSETGTALTHTFTTTGAHYVSCTATDSDIYAPASATSSASILVTNPAAVGTLSIHTGYEGMKVTRHDISTFALLEEKLTDENGDATFNVTGDRTTFAITSWSGMKIHKRLLMEAFKKTMDAKANEECNKDSSVATECSSADWCAIYESDSIADWIWQVSINSSRVDSLEDHLNNAKDVDSNGDGQIDMDELYAEALASLDTDKDGQISFAELEIKDIDIKIDMYANVPVRDYYFHIEPDIALEDYSEYDYSYYICEEETFFFDANLTLHFDANISAGNKYASASGSGQGWLAGRETDTNGNITMHLNAFKKDSDGKFSYLLKERSESDAKYNYLLLSGKTEDEIKAGLTLEASTFKPSDKNVTIGDMGEGRFYILTMYKGLVLESSDDYLNSGTSTMFYTNPAFAYSYVGEDYSGNLIREHQGYYTDTTLQSSYDVSDYPFLDANVSFTTDSWSIFGADVGKANYVYYDYYSHAHDDNTSVDSSLSVSVTWTVPVTKMPAVDIADIMPSDIKADAAYVIGLAEYAHEEVGIGEVKGLSETQFLDLISSSYDASESSEFSIDKIGSRENRASKFTDAPASVTAKRTSLFGIKYDISRTLTK